MGPLVKVSVRLLLATREDDGTFVAKCPFLNIVTSGESKQQAVDNLKEEIDFFFESCREDDSLLAVMDKRTAFPREPYSEDDFVKVEIGYEVPDSIPADALRRITDAAVQVT